MLRIAALTRNHRLGTAFVAVFVALLAACGDESPTPLAPAPAASLSKTGTGKPGTIETVLFVGSVDGNTDIYAMNPDGSNVRRLTTDPRTELQPDFAPDNRTFVFARLIDNNHSELFTANADGSKEKQLTELGTFPLAPRYSPDGTKIAFTASVPGLGQEIFVMNADGTGVKQLTFVAAAHRFPTWSPDGKSIAFESDIGGTRSIRIMNADGLNERPLLPCFDLGCGQPAFSPVGNKIAVADFGAGNIAVFDLDNPAFGLVGVGPIGVKGISTHPTWTKDGTRVVFASERGIEAGDELYIGTPGNEDPKSVRRLTVFSPGEAFQPSFSH